MYYLYLFSKKSSVDSQRFLNELSVAVFLLYRATLLQDDFMDEEGVSKENLLISKKLKEESYRILRAMFDKDSVFWRNWEERKREYLKGYELNKSLKEIESFDEFITLCDFKSSMGKVAIDCMAAKFPNSLPFDNVYKSHKFFYVAFQILDDIEDLDED